MTRQDVLDDAVAALLGVEDAGERSRLGARVAGIASAFPVPARAGLHVGAGTLDALARLMTGRRLRALSAVQREALCTLIAARPGGAQLVDALKVPALLAAGTDRLPAPAETTVTQRGEEPWLDCVPAGEWPSRATADAVVVGSGAGGAMAARDLARAGLSVVVVEEGSRHTAAEFRSSAPLDRFLKLYRDGGSTVALGVPPVLLPMGRGVGGTTLVNCGTSYRTPDRVLRRWHDLGVDVSDFPGLLDEVEQTLRVARQPLDVIGRNGMLALEGARKLGWKAAPLRRNAPGCDGCCQCVVGCPHNAKNGVQLNALPQACAAGARIITEAWVERILTESSRAAGIVVRRRDGSTLEILAPMVVVAAGATQTPLLLRRSGLGGHPELGRGMAVHPATSLAGRFDEPVVSWQGVLQSVGVEELHEHGILIEATASPPGMSSFVLPGVGRALQAELSAADHLAVLGAMVADAPSGRVHGRRHAVIRYDLTREDGAKLRRAMLAMGRVLFAAGAREILTGLARRPLARTPEDLAHIVATTSARELHLAGFHPTGTARMGADPRRTPVDQTGALRGVRGVWITDASVLPTCPEVNPQLTIMATARHITSRILAHGGRAASLERPAPPRRR